MTFDEYSNSLDAFASSFNTKANEINRLEALETLKNVILSTPRDTGRAASNWFISFDSPSDEVTDDANPDKALSEQSGKLLSPTKSKIIWLVNNLPYIARLNDGWSDQAPAGFVEKSLKAAEKAISKAKF